MSAASHNPDLLRLAADITAAYLSRNPVSSDELPGLIRSVYAALSSAGMEAPATDQPQPAVPVKRSVFPNYIICLEDGRKLRMLTRHLQSSYGLTPAAYRQRWGLPDSYPMVAPSYAAIRSALAKATGLGRKREPTATEKPSLPPVQHVPEGKRGRKVARRDQAVQR